MFVDGFVKSVGSRDATLTVFFLLLFCFNFLSECALLLLAHNAPVKIKNSQGWSPLAEAISYGDRQMSKSAMECLRVLECDVVSGAVNQEDSVGTLAGS